MPYKVYHENGKYCVHKHVNGQKGDLVPGGCHSTPEEARRHQAALYVHVEDSKEIEMLDPLDLVIVEEEFDAEKKEQGEEKEIARPALPAGVATSFAELDAQREYSERMRTLDERMADFQMLVGNVIYSPADMLEVDKVEALSNLFDEFKDEVDVTLNEPLDSEDKELGELNEEKAKRSDVSEADKKRAVGEYGDVTYADETNKKYPIDTAAHIHAAWNYIRMPKNAKKYPDGGAAIKRKIIAAWKKKIDPAGPPAARKGLPDYYEMVVKAIKEIFGFEEPKPLENYLTVWKEADGSYSWLSTYSNKFLDDDRPRQILSSTSHQKFVEKVDKGLAPLPEAWIWHVPQWKFGYATAMAYDDAGFPIAIGKVDKGCEEIAEWLSTQEDFGVSHGMWSKSIKFDSDDPSVITEYETYEISPLPRARAANKLADFVVLSKEQKEDVMTIPEEKRAELLKRGLPETLLTALEERNKAKADKATSEGIKSKEEPATSSTENQPVPDEKKEEEKVEETQEETKPAEETSASADTSQYPTREEIAEAIASVVAPIVNEVKERMTQVEAAFKEMQASDEKRLKEILSTTPRDSLATMMAQRLVKSSSASADTVVPKGDNLLGKKPKETKAQKQGVGIHFIDKMISPEESKE